MACEVSFRIATLTTCAFLAGGCFNPGGLIEDDREAGSDGVEADDDDDDDSVGDDDDDDDDDDDVGTGTDDGSVPCGGMCENGTCDDDDTCVCDDGWEGPSCADDIDDCFDVDCGNGTCVDQLAAFQCVCDEGWEGDACAALQMPLCLRGSLTVTDALDVVNGNPATGAFEGYEGSAVDFSIVFEIGDEYVGIGNGEFGDPDGQLRTVETAGLSVQSNDAWFDGTFGAAFDGSSQEVILVNGSEQGVDLGNMVSPTASQYWGLETSSVLDMPIVIDPATGFPALLPSEGPGSGTVILRRYQTGSPLMTDFAYATWAPALMNGPNCE